MGVYENPDWPRNAASTLDWWRDAGVDVLVEDTAFDWFAAPAVDARAPAPAVSAAASDALPDTMQAFAAWRLGAAAPDAGWRGAALAAEGDPAAELMVLVDCPERDDADRLMQGRAGALFDRMLAAMGRSRADVYLAAVCLRRPTTGRMPRDTHETLARIARHHVELAAPRRLLVLGDAASRAVLATNDGAIRGRLHALNHRNGTVTHAVASFHPRFLLDQPAAKAEAWRDLMLLTKDTDQ